ncbi:MAG TPA: gliding motility-associated C-terminal domain-containing protein [Chitinophagaceae bacterium]|jgi:gliding motility-associated-like protein|nr:gliding motility-associated C-terminal domain-containing protein [Chitinophagaceae bacterium]
MIRAVGVFFLSLLFVDLHAQLCTGSLGDPIVHITFGQGSNPGGSLSAASTSYLYVTNDCPNDGYYTVRNSTTACFGNSWHTVNADHTGDPGGYFMLVNASVQPGAFYIDTVKGLCGGTTYEFAAWIMNVLLPSACSGSGTRPDLSLSIEKTDGTVLQTYNTGNISTFATPQWNQYGSFFTTPAGVTDIVLRIVNNAPGGCGNDLALDDITFRACGPQVSGTIDGIPDYDTSFCEGPSRMFVLGCTVSGGFTTPVFQWQQRTIPQSNWTDIGGAITNNFPASFITNATPGLYQFRLAVAESGNIGSPACRVYSKSFAITINANPVTTAVNNGPACTNSSLNLSATGGTRYDWIGPNAFTATGTPVTINNIQPAGAGKYYVTVSSAAGCKHLDSTTVAVNPVPIASTSFSNVTICEDDSSQLSASGGTAYQWIPATGLSNPMIANPKASPAQTTTYSTIVSNAFSCKDTADVTINIIPKPVANAGPDKIIFEGQSVRLSGAVPGTGNTFSWSPTTYMDDNTLLQPLVNPPADQNYILTVVSGFGCGTSSDQVLVKVYKDIFIPTGFTPNGDGLNDDWKILGIEALSAYRVSVYNRWGETVFQTTDIPRGWDGKYKGVPQPAGVYVYYVEKGVERVVVKGTMVLIR